MSEGAPQGPTKLPRGILPDGINLPPGTDIMQFCRDLAESGADFAEQFDRDSATYHGGNTTAVPLGGARLPESMPEAVPAVLGAEAVKATDWESIPERPPMLAIEEDFGPGYALAMAAYKQLDSCKKSISVLNKPVEMAMKLRVQYKDSLSGTLSGKERTGEDNNTWLSRLKGAENERDGALASATEYILSMNKSDCSDRTRECVENVVAEGKFEFEDRERFGEYMQVLQRANQAIFMDQRKLLAKIKEIKKAAKATQVVEQVVATPVVEQVVDEKSAKGGGKGYKSSEAAEEASAENKAEGGA